MVKEIEKKLLGENPQSQEALKIAKINTYLTQAVEGLIHSKKFALPKGVCGELMSNEAHRCVRV